MKTRFSTSFVFLFVPASTLLLALGNAQPTMPQVQTSERLATAYSISGKVADISNNSISGVTISDGVGDTTITDSNGNYMLGSLAAGTYTYTLTASKSGYTLSPSSRVVSGCPG